MGINPYNFKNIYLMGIMGCGKTAIGKILAKKVGFPFIDTDELVVQRSGISISGIFSRYGELEFRRLEKLIIQEISGLNRHVVALGGGTVLDSDNWSRITATGITITLSYPAETIHSRLLLKKDRPLIDSYKNDGRLERIRNLIESRNHIYFKADLVIHLNSAIPKRRVVSMLESFIGKRV